LYAQGKSQHHRGMGTPPHRLPVFDSFSSTGQASPSSSSANSSAAANRETEMAPPSRYVLPKDLDAAISTSMMNNSTGWFQSHLKNGLDEKSRLCTIKVSGMPKPFLLNCRKGS
jgi:hypothetical protein